jgi:hypothetical protein
MGGPTVCERRWAETLASFVRNMVNLTVKHPECIKDIKLLQAALLTIEQLINSSSRVNGNDAELKGIITKTQEEKAVLCKHLEGQTLFSGMLRLYAATNWDLMNSLKQEEEKPSGETKADPGQNNQEFREQKRRNRTPTGEKEKIVKKFDTATPTPRESRIQPQGEVPTKNYFTPLRTTEMDIERPVAEGSTRRRTASGVIQKVRQAAPIVLTSTTNLIHLQSKFKGFVSGSFEFRNTRSGTRIVTKEMADFSAIKTSLERNELSYYTFSAKSEKTIKAVIRHLPLHTPAEDISDELVSLGFDVVSVKQMTTAGILQKDQPPQSFPCSSLPCLGRQNLNKYFN